VVGGVDLAADLDDAEVGAIRSALLEHEVIFLRDQDLDPDAQVAFSHRLGPPSPVPFIEPIAGHPEVIAVVRDATEAHDFTFGSLWHSDFSFLAEPPCASMLHALEVPPFGGDTIFASQTRAYHRCSKAMQALLDRLDGVHSAVNAYAPAMQAVHDSFVGMTVRTDESARATQVHPVVRVHGETGRRALFVNAQYTIGLAGFAPFEAKVLLDYLFALGTRVELTCRWSWRVGDVAIWDNRSVQHMAMADFTGHRRAMHRTTVAGEVPLPAPR
jgi:taurine dioxygenase